MTQNAKPAIALLVYDKMKTHHRCKTKYCRRRTADGDHRCCQRCRLRAWRNRNPIRAIWLNHVRHAKDRGIAVEWTFDQFKVWCVEWKFLYRKQHKDGTIHRKKCWLGYSMSNCVVLSHAENSKLGWSVERWLKEKIDKWEKSKEARRRATMLAARCE